MMTGGAGSLNLKTFAALGKSLMPALPKLEANTDARSHLNQISSLASSGLDTLSVVVPTRESVAAA